MEKISYKLDDFQFEGPLDLLLHLISKNKLDICNIPIAQLVDQYMEHINKMQEADIDIASEFLAMASRLLYIKTAMLLPRHEEADEMKKELVGELIEYQLARQMANKLADRADFDHFSRAEMYIEADNTYRLSHDVSVLYNAYIAAAGRQRRKEESNPAKQFENFVQRPPVAVSSRVVNIIRRLRKNGIVELSPLFMESTSKSEAVATFLAVLELLQARRVYLKDDKFICPLERKREKRSEQSDAAQ